MIVPSRQCKAIAFVAHLVLPSGARQPGSGDDVTIMATKTFISPGLAIYNCDMGTESGTCPLLALLHSPPSSSQSSYLSVLARSEKRRVR